MYQPGPITAGLLPLAAWVSPRLLALNVGVATLQVIVAAGLLARRTRRAALVVSAAWALAVWVIGEGLGGMATGTALMEFGAPGAALVYAGVAGMLRFWVLGALLHLPLIHPAGAVLAYNLQSAAQDQPGGARRPRLRAGPFHRRARGGNIGRARALRAGDGGPRLA